jgi:hypothetical protein
VKTKIISPFGEIVKNINIRNYREKMRFPIKKNTFSRHGGTIKPSPLQPVLPLVPETLPTKEQDKSKFISFELKSRAGQPAGSTTYKKFVRVFEEGTPQQWIDLIHDLEEIWTQNSVNGPTDRVSTIRALLKGESLTAFDTALEDARVDPDPNVQAPLQLTLEHIVDSMDQVADTVFPHRALETQKLWMNRGMRKPFEMTTRKTAAAITKINNSLPLFPLGTNDSKFSDRELVGLIEWSLPPHWRKKFDLDGYIPTLGTKAKLISECEAIERNETTEKKRKDDDDNNNNNYKKNKFGNSAARAPKNGNNNNGSFFCKHCGRNRTHDTSKCYFLKDKTQRFNGKTSDNNKEASQKDRPFSRRTFRKEVNTLARKASKKGALGVYASALKRQQDKESKSKVAKRRAFEKEDSSSSDDSMSVNNMEKRVPRSLSKPIPRKVVKNILSKMKIEKKDNKKASKKTEKEDFLAEAVNNMQLDEDDIEMIDSDDDDVLSLNSNEMDI